MPAVVTFVAPAYPRVAKGQRNMGRTAPESTLVLVGPLRRSSSNEFVQRASLLFLLPRRQGECLVIRPTRRANHEQRRRKNRQEFAHALDVGLHLPGKHTGS